MTTELQALLHTRFAVGRVERKSEIEGQSNSKIKSSIVTIIFPAAYRICSWKSTSKPQAIRHRSESARAPHAPGTRAHRKAADIDHPQENAANGARHHRRRRTLEAVPHAVVSTSLSTLMTGHFFGARRALRAYLCRTPPPAPSTGSERDESVTEYSPALWIASRPCRRSSLRSTCNVPTRIWASASHTSICSARAARYLAKYMALSPPPASASVSTLKLTQMPVAVWLLLLAADVSTLSATAASSS